ncbi:Translation initiation factor IF-3 [Candidatus Izimaplasma bacterium HR1]|nr:Translation initiation factor IF-3 [Candidatus Izimaplasma bacterium HR1]
MGTLCTHTFYILSTKQNLYALGGVTIKKYSREMPAKRKDDSILNEGIRAREVMVITDSGEKLGVINTRTALSQAYDKNLDLVLVAPGAKPPVAKFMDYNKYKYEQQRKQREARKNQKIVSLKEIRLSPKIDIGDFNTKLKNGRKFLDNGDKLKISIRFRGREMAYTNKGREIMLKYAEQCADIATIESMPKKDGRNMFMSLTPIKDKK